MEPTSSIVSALVTAGSEDAAKEAAGLMQQLLGPAFEELGQAIRDRVILFRAGRVVRLMDRAQSLLREAGREPQRVAPKTLLTILEGASLEDDDDLSDYWAALLANASIEENLSYGASFGAILRQLTPEDAQVLTALWVVRAQAPDSGSGPRGGVNLNALYGGVGSLVGESGRTHYISEATALIETYPALQNLWAMPADRLVVSVENLLRLGVLSDQSVSLIPVATEAVDIGDYLPAQLQELPKYIKQAISSPRRERVVFSHLGVAFMQACEPPAANRTA